MQTPIREESAPPGSRGAGDPPALGDEDDIGAVVREIIASVRARA